jgi:hypothetical protein
VSRRALLRAPMLRETLCVMVVAGATLAASFVGMRAARSHGVVPFFYQSYYEPAVRVACGQPFGTDRAGPRSAELTAFLELKRDSLSCEAVPPPLDPDPNPPTRICYHLFVTVAAVWRVAGICWAAIDWVAAVMLAISAVSVYGIFRLYMRAPIACPLAVVSVLPGLRFLLYLRDMNKAPFLLSSFFLVALLATRKLSSRRVLALMTTSGLWLGVGYGFRPDVLIALPLLSATAVLSAGHSCGAPSPAAWSARS